MSLTSFSGQSDHRVAVSPVTDVILERQEIKQQLQELTTAHVIITPLKQHITRVKAVRKHKPLPRPNPSIRSILRSASL